MGGVKTVMLAVKTSQVGGFHTSLQIKIQVGAVNLVLVPSPNSSENLDFGPSEVWRFSNAARPKRLKTTPSPPPSPSKNQFRPSIFTSRSFVQNGGRQPHFRPSDKSEPFSVFFRKL